MEIKQPFCLRVFQCTRNSEGVQRYEAFIDPQEYRENIYV